MTINTFDEAIRTYETCTGNYEGNAPSNESEYDNWNNINPDVFSPPDTRPAWSELEKKMAQLLVVWRRKKEYPHWTKQLEKIYDDGIDKWKSEMVDPVKAAHPKP